MINRRTFLKLSSAGALTLYALNEFGLEEADRRNPGGHAPARCDPEVRCATSEPTSDAHIGARTSTRSRCGSSASRSFRPPLPPTTVWSYGSTTSVDLQLPAFTIEATRARRSR